jgi:hypothetical protein
MRHSWKLLSLLSLLVGLSCPAWSLNPDYNFSFVAINGKTIDGLVLNGYFGSGQCINDLGEIVFTASYGPIPTDNGSGIFTPTQVLFKTGDVVDGQVLTGVGGCALNNAGTLIFGAGLPSGKGALFIKERGKPAKCLVLGGQKIDGLELLFFPTFAINDYGQIAFSAYYKSSKGLIETGIFGPHAALLLPGSKVDNYVLTSIDPTFALSSRELFYHASNAKIGEGIFETLHLILKTGDEISGHQLMGEGGSTFGYLAASDNGKLVFGAGFADGSGIFSPHSILASTTGLLPEPAAVNNAGVIVYYGADGLVVNQTPLINNGDAIDGHILNGLNLPPSINNFGAIVFEAEFTDGSEGFVLATPKKW